MRALAPWAVVALPLVLGACRREQPEQAAPPPANDAAPAPTTPDRLPPGELLEGDRRAFGFPIPRDMQIERRTERIAHARGQISIEPVANYVRQRVLSSHVEMLAKRLVFPKARLRGNQQSLLRIEIIDEGVHTHLIIKDISGPEPPPGLTDAERWKRAGMTPQGKLIDPQNLE